MNADSRRTPHLDSPLFRVSAGRLQRLFLLILLIAVPVLRATDLRQGRVYSVTITDVDQQQISTADGHVTVVTVVTRKDEDKAQAVGDRFPREYLADSKFRLITVVNFQQKIFGPFRGLALGIIRYRLDAEAKELQKVYATKHLNRNARSDILVAADFDGKTVAEFGIPANSSEFAVFVFDGRGRLVKHWDDVPSAEALTAALDEAR
jgi:hypothetical protein